MTVIFLIAHKSPNSTEELICKDVANFTVDEGKGFIKVFYNDAPEETFYIKDTTGKTLFDWFLLSVNAYQVPLKIEDKGGNNEKK